MILIYLAYVGSLALAFSMVHSFAIFGYGEMLLIAISVLTPTMLLAFHLAKNNSVLILAGAHILLAVLFHPAATYKEPKYISTSEQFALVREINQSNHSWWVKADMSYSLAQALRAETNFRLKTESPLIYWIFPPSVALTLWAVLIYFRFPTESEK